MTEPYITTEEIRQYLTNIGTGTDADNTLEVIAARATDIVDTHLGFSFDGYSTEERIVYGVGGSSFLTLPAHSMGTVTSVVLGAGDPLTDWSETIDGMLLRTNTASIYYSPYVAGYLGGWGGYGYTVTADWGYGDVPEAVKEVTLEIAVNIWRSKDKGLWADVIGVEGSGGIRYIGGLTNQQREILDRVKDKYAGSAVFA